jgi:uncharacterized protein YehS (DUF1456 family)
MKTTWNVIHKEKGNLTNENNIKLLRINNHIVYNKISIANEFKAQEVINTLTYKNFQVFMKSW